MRMLPKWTESDIETLLTSFEQLGITNYCPRDKYLAIIQTQMSPKALKICNEFRIDITYDEAKEKLLLAYYFVPENYR